MRSAPTGSWSPEPSDDRTPLAVRRDEAPASKPRSDCPSGVLTLFCDHAHAKMRVSISTAIRAADQEACGPMGQTNSNASLRIGLAAVRNAPSVEERLRTLDRCLAAAAAQDIAIVCF